MNISNNTSKRKKILIVEDEESNYELLKAMLRKKPFDIVWAQAGNQAITLCNEQDFHLILMDIKMPEMSGYEVLHILREQGLKIPIIAQTAYARLEDENKALSAGFDGYLSKPIDRNKLNELVDKFLYD